jgi:5-formyltetrahydrofolate cyclo-ligase
MAADAALLEAKRSLRQAMGQARDKLDPVARALASKLACQRALSLPQVQAARTLAAFATTRGELDVAALAAKHLALGGRVVYPRVVSGLSPRLRFHVVLHPGELVPGAFGIPEPPAAAPEVPVEELDLVVVPGLAFDGQGRRLGYGGGYYDEVAARLRGAGRGFLLGVGFDFQLIETCPADERDVAIDCVVTDARIVRRH